MSAKSREVMFVIQFVGNIIILGLVVALIYTASVNIAHSARAQTAANRQILDHLQRVFINHAIVSTKQNCAISSEIAFLVASSPMAPPALIHRVNRFVHNACKVEVVPPLALEPGSASSSPASSTSPHPGGSPVPSGQPTSGPTPTTSPSPSPSPSLICLPDIGCL